MMLPQATGRELSFYIFNTEGHLPRSHLPRRIVHRFARQSAPGPRDFSCQYRGPRRAF